MAPPLDNGKKKAKFFETLPSSNAQRVEPTISEEIRKKIQLSVKTKESKMKKGVKREVKEEEGEEQDEFDDMVKSKKTLKDKLGTPEEVAKKTRKKKENVGDGLKQSKLNFPKVNGSPKKKGRKKRDDSELESETEHSDIGSDVEFKSNVSSPVVNERTVRRRASAKMIKYSLSDEDEKSEGEPELFENSAIVEKNHQEVLVSSDEEEKPPPRHETSEDMFDSLIGKKKEESKPAEVTNKRKKIDESQSDSDDAFSKKTKPHLLSSDEDMFEGISKPKETKPKKPRQKKKKTSGDESSSKKTKTKKKKTDSSDDSFSFKKTKSKKKNTDTSDDEFSKKLKSSKKNDSSDDEAFRPVKAKNKSKSTKKKASSDSEFEVDKLEDSGGHSDVSNPPEVVRSVRPGRGAAKSKYTFDDSDEESF